MAVRPFYTEISIDGRKTNLTGGPRNKDGGMYISVYQRNDGGIDTAFKIRSYSRTVEGKHTLFTDVVDSEGKVVATHSTKY